MIRAVLGRLTERNPAARHTAIYFSTIVVGQVASLLFLPLVTRFFSPAEFGEYSLVLAITGLLGIIGSVWVRNVAMRLYFDHVERQQTRQFFVTAAVLQLLAMTTVLAIGYVVTIVALTPVSLSMFVWGGASVLVADFYSLTANTLRAAQRSTAFGIAEITSAVLRLGFTALGLFVGIRGPAMLFACATAGVGAAALFAARALWPLLTGPMRVERAVSAELMRLGIPSVPQSISSWVMVLSDRLLLARFMDVAAVGTYSVAYSTADRAVSGLASALLMAAWPAILDTWTVDRARTADQITRSLGAFVLLTLGPSVLLVMQRDFVLSVLMSAEYASAAGVIPWVVAGAWLAGAATYLNRPLELHKRYGALSWIAVVAAVINVALNLWAIPRWGVIGAAVSTTAAFTAWTVLSRVLAQRFLVVPLPWRAIIAAAAASVVAVAVSALLPNAVAAIAVFVAIYVALIGGFWMLTVYRTR